MQYKEDDKHLKDDIEIFDGCINELLNNVDQYVKLPETDQWDDNTIKIVDIIKCYNIKEIGFIRW